MKKIVLDTNVLLVCISDKSELHWIFKGLLNQEYVLCVTTDILNEYAEIIERHMVNSASEAVLGVLENLANVHFITIYYKFNLLKDSDDNKFVDCAISGNAEFIVSHDKDFNLLKNIEFPKVEVLDVQEFKQKLEK